MTSLPPYSTFRTDNKQMMYPQATSHGNILTFTPPGFKQTLNVKFPDSRLAVCEKCKKNYKTRDMCRVRNNHTGAPWTTAFICITLDASCTDESGKYVDKPLTVRMVQWQPYCVKKPFDSKTPVCSSCKKTNRTRSYCRGKHRHLQLPWCTVYVILSAVDSTDPATVVAAPSKPLENGSECAENESKDQDTTEKAAANDQCEVRLKEESETEETTSPKDQSDGNAHEKEQPSENSPASKKEESSKKVKPDEDEGDDIDAIEKSRTFLAKVSCRSNTIHWLELSDDIPLDSTALSAESHAQVLNAAIHNPAIGFPMDPTQYYAHMVSMGYTPQQIQAIMVQNQHYYQIHQQSYAAQHAAWQASYNQHIQAQMAGQAFSGSVPVFFGAPQHSMTTPVPAPQASPVAAAPAMTLPMPALAPVAQHPPQQIVYPATATAGEAATAKQQERRKKNGKEGDIVTAEAAQTTAAAPMSADTSSAAMSQQQHAQAQWQAHMIYQQQLYQQQLHYHQAAAVAAAAQHQAASGQTEAAAATPFEKGEEDAGQHNEITAPPPVDDDDDADSIDAEERDSKRPHIEAL